VNQARQPSFRETRTTVRTRYVAVDINVVVAADNYTASIGIGFAALHNTCIDDGFVYKPTCTLPPDRSPFTGDHCFAVGKLSDDTS